MISLLVTDHSCLSLRSMSVVQHIRRKLQIRYGWKSDKTRRVAAFWQQGGPDCGYFQAADKDHWVQTFWASDSVFRAAFEQLDRTSMLEIACGSGRHSWQVRGTLPDLTLLDTSQGALSLARQRFVHYPQVQYIHAPTGLGLADCGITKETFTSIFSFDAMVHFEPKTVQAYLHDSFRVLKPGGRCLFHHSNYDQRPGGDFARNPGWRNYMNTQLFNEFATAAGFQIVSQQTLSFVGPGSDALTLLQK